MVNKYLFRVEDAYLISSKVKLSPVINKTIKHNTGFNHETSFTGKKKKMHKNGHPEKKCGL